MDLVRDTITGIVKRVPAVLPHLKGEARWIAYSMGGAEAGQTFEGKSVEYYLRTLQGLIRSVYNNMLGGEFIDIMANLIQGQLTQAFQQAIDESDVDWLPEMRGQLQVMILNEYGYVDQLFRDIINARID
jgi:hypothetical protein